MNLKCDEVLNLSLRRYGGGVKQLALESSFLPHLPAVDLAEAAGRYNTCAVVGNSGLLLHHERRGHTHSLADCSV